MNISNKINDALVLCNSNRYDDAKEILFKVLKKDKKNVDAIVHLGRIYFIQNHFQDAEKFIHEALGLRKSKELKIILINIKIRLNKKNEALFLIDEVLKSEKDIENIQLEITKAQLLRELGDIDQAIIILKDIISRNSNEINVFVSLGYTYNLIEKYNEAIECYLNALKINDGYFPALFNLGITLLNQASNFDGAIKYLEQARSIQNNNENLLLTLAKAYEEKRDFPSAVLRAQEAIKLNPNNSRAHFQLACINIHMGNLDNSILQLIDKSIELDSNNFEAKYLKGIYFLKEKNYINGMDFYRWRVKKNNLFIKFRDDYLVNEIKDDDSLLIFYEQGIGDQLLYARFMEEVANQANKCVIVLQDKIVSLIKNSFPHLNIIPESDYDPNKYNEYKKINLSTTARLVSDVEKNLKNPILLTVDDTIKNKIKKKYQNNKIIGISWRSKNKFLGHNKSIELKEIIQNIDLPDNHIFLNLQYGDVDDEIKNLSQKIEIDNDINLYDDIDGLAALIDSCEFIITTSNITAHLAGSLGKRTYLLAPHGLGLFWYWYDQKIIYKSIENYYQDKDGSWLNAIKKINSDIKKNNES